MSSSTATQHNTTSNRFFAFTPARLAAVTEYDLSRAELLVWAAVEMGAKPRRPVAFSLEGLAETLRLSVDSVRRAVRRLLGVGLVVGFFKGNKHHLAPAVGAWEGSRADLASVQGSDNSGLAFSPSGEANVPSTGAGVSPHSLASVQGCFPENADSEDACGTSPNIRFSEDESKLSLCLVGQELVNAWNVYPKVAADLVERYGQERVSEVMAWGRWLKGKGKIRSLGWVYQALVRGWNVPDGFQKATKAPEGRCNSAANPLQPVQPVTEEAPAEPDPERQRETVAQMLASPVPGVRRLGERLAAEWGVVIEAERAV